MLSDQKKIDKLTSSYRDSSKKLRNEELGFKHYSACDLEICKDTIAQIDDAIKFLHEREKFIIYNEVVLGKRGKWYLEYYSPSAFKVRRKFAHKEFLRILEL